MHWLISSTRRSRPGGENHYPGDGSWRRVFNGGMAGRMDWLCRTTSVLLAQGGGHQVPEGKMLQTIAHITLVVRDYDEAIAFFTETLSFDLIEDCPAKDRQGRHKRWVLLAPRGSRATQILLAKASNDEEASRIGNQTGGRVFLFLHTDDFWRDYNTMREKGVKFIREPKQQEYGTVAVFEDLYGNKWDLLQPKRNDDQRKAGS
jgi:catechol 2,3-dioxygenase-like lactoylglutathione lyase family enzyme